MAKVTINISKLFKEHSRFMKKIEKLSLAEAVQLRDSGKVKNESEFDSLCAYIGSKMKASAQ